MSTHVRPGPFVERSTGARLRQPSGLIPESGWTLPPRALNVLAWIVTVETSILAALLLIWVLDHV